MGIEQGSKSDDFSRQAGLRQSPDSDRGFRHWWTCKVLPAFIVFAYLTSACNDGQGGDTPTGTPEATPNATQTVVGEMTKLAPTLVAYLGLLTAEAAENPIPDPLKDLVATAQAGNTLLPPLGTPVPPDPTMEFLGTQLADQLAETAQPNAQP